jgi:hypothetical protein
VLFARRWNCTKSTGNSAPLWGRYCLQCHRSTTALEMCLNGLNSRQAVRFLMSSHEPTSVRTMFCPFRKHLVHASCHVLSALAPTVPVAVAPAASKLFSETANAVRA